MFSLIVSIIAIALASVLVLAAVYYGHQAYTRAHIRAAAAKAISQSVQVLGAAELFHADHERWPTGVDELLDSGYLRENPMYVATAAPVTQVLARWGVPSAMADINGESGSEVIGGEDHSTGGNHSAEINEAAKNGKMRWDAPLKRRPTYWVLRSTDAEVCKEVNRVARGDNGIYKGVVPGLVTQCFGVEAPYTVVTTRDASPGYWQFLLEHWNEDDIFYSHDFAWSIKPTIVDSTYQFNPLPLGVGALPDWGTPGGGYLDGTIQVSVNGENTNTGSTAIGPSEVDVLIWGDGPDTWGVPIGEGVDMGGTGGSGWGTGGDGNYEGTGGGGSGWGTGGSGDTEGTGGKGVSIDDVSVDKPGFTVTSTCPTNKPLDAGSSCKFVVTPPPLPPGATSCVTYKVELTIETSNGTVKVPLSTQACPKEIEEELNKIPVKVEGLDEKDKADQWWFKDTRVGTVGTKWVRLTNTGTAPLYTDTPSLALKAPFSVASNECPSLLWPGSNCMVLLHFTPTAVQLYGNNQYPITLRSDIGVHSYYLNGYGLTALTYGAEVTPGSLFITPVYDGSSAYGTVTLKNTGNAKLNIDKAPEVISPTGVFSIRNTNCTSNGLGGYGSCQISVNIIPNKTGVEQGTLVVSTVEGGVMQVPLQANVQVPFTMSGGKLPVGHAKSAYNSGDIRSFVTIRSGGSVGDRVKFVVTGLPYGLVFNPNTYQITGTIAGSVAPDTYNVNVTASFMDGKYTTKAVLQIPVEPIPESRWLPDYSKVSSYGNTLTVTGRDYMANVTPFGNYVAMRNDALRTRALVKGQFKVTGEYADLIRISNIYYLTPNASFADCGANIAPDGKSAQCTRYPKSVGEAIGVVMYVYGVGNQPVKNPGVYNNYVQFYPDEDSSVLAPTEPLKVVQPWETTQKLIITDEGYVNASSKPVTEYSYGNLAANSGLSSSRRFTLRSINALGRLGGTWKIVDDTDDAFVIDSVQTWPHPYYSGTSNPTANYYCYGETGPLAPMSDEAYCAAKWHPAESGWSELAVVVRFTERGAAELGTKTSNAKLVFIPDPKWSDAEAVHPLEVSLSGNTQLTQGVSLVANQSAYTTADLAKVDFGDAYANTGSPITRRFMIRQKDATGQIGGTWKIDGVSNYRIARFGTYYRTLTSYHTSYESLCEGRGNVFPLETEKQGVYCTGGHPAKNTYSDLWVEVQYVPHAMTERGEIQDDAKLIFVPDTKYPFSTDNKMEVDLTAKTRYSNDIFMSLDSSLVEEVAETSFNKLPTRATAQTTKRFFIRSQNRFSEIKGTWSIEGDPNFTLVNVGAIHYNSTSTGAVCQGATGLALADVREATCEGYNPITGNYYDLFVDVKYTPDVTTTEGTYTHNAVLKFTPAEDKPLSALNKLEAALVGQTELDQTVVLTTGVNATAAATTEYDFGIRVPTHAQYTTKAFFIRSSTNYGKLSGTWKVEGDANFKIVRVGSASRGYAENSYSNYCTGLTTYNVNTREVACEAAYHPYNYTLYQDLFVVVQFDAEQTTVHDLHQHQAVLTFTPDQENHPVKSTTELKVNLAGQTRYGQIAVMVQGEGNTIDDVYASHTFKDLPADFNGADTKRIYLRGTTNGAPIAGKWMIEGDSNFTITSVAAEYRNYIYDNSRAYCSGKSTYNVSSSQGPVDCVAGHPASVVRSDQSVDVTYRSQRLDGLTSATNSARLYFVPDDSNALFGLAPLEVQLSGKSYTQQSAFLTTKNTVPAVHETTLRVPDTPQNGYREAVMYVRGATLFGHVGAKFRIEDPSEQFTITAVNSINRGSTSPTTCLTHTLTTTEASCKAHHPVSWGYSDVGVTVRFTPKAVKANNFVTSTAKLIVEPLEGVPYDNFTSPIEVELTSRTSIGIPVLMTKGTSSEPEAAITELKFVDTIANNGQSTYESVYLRSPATYGQMDGTWVITGGSGAFTITGIGSVYPNNMGFYYCQNRSTTTVSTLSAYCRSTAVEQNRSDYTQQAAQIRFTPPTTKKLGGEEYTAKLEFIPNGSNTAFDINGKPTISIELKGKSLLEQEVSLTSSDTLVHPGEVDFGQVVANRNTLVTKNFALRTSNNTGRLNGSWVLEGDSAFTLSAAGTFSKSYLTSNYFQSPCSGLSSTAVNTRGPLNCMAPYHPQTANGYYAYPTELIVQVKFQPGTTRVDGLNNYSAKLKFIPSVDYPVSANTPLEIELKGSAFNGTSAVLSEGIPYNVSYSSYVATSNFGEVHANLSRYVDKVFALRAVDRNGQIHGSWKLEGSSEFTITDVKVLRYDTSSGTTTCNSPSNTVFGGRGPYLCIANAGNSTYSDQIVTVRYRPSAATHNGSITSTAKLSFTPSAGYQLTPSQSESFEVDLVGTSVNGVNYTMTTSTSFAGTSNAVVDMGTYKSYYNTSSTTALVYIRTDNTRGQLKGNVEIVDDANNVFTITEVSLGSPGTSTKYTSCLSGNAVWGGKGPYLCEAYNSAQYGSGSHIRVLISAKQLAATKLGGEEYTAKVKFTPAPGYPGDVVGQSELPIKLKMEYNATATISLTGSQDTSLATNGYDFGVQNAGNGSVTRRFYLRGGGDAGRLEGVWTLQGNSNFAIVAKGVSYRGYSSNSYTTSCSVGGSGFTANRAECAGMYLYSTTYSDLYVDVRFTANAMSNAGTELKSAVLKFTPSAKTPVEALAPLEVTMVGSIVKQ